MRASALVGVLVVASSSVAARPAGESDNPAPPGSAQLIMPSGMIDDRPAISVSDPLPILDDRESDNVTSGPASVVTGSQRAPRRSDTFQSGGFRFNVANLKILGGQIGGNGVYRGAVVTLNWGY